MILSRRFKSAKPYHLRRLWRRKGNNRFIKTYLDW
jgi:hypothetical protein